MNLKLEFKNLNEELPPDKSCISVFRRSDTVVGSYLIYEEGIVELIWIDTDPSDRGNYAVSLYPEKERDSWVKCMLFRGFQFELDTEDFYWMLMSDLKKPFEKESHDHAE